MTNRNSGDPGSAAPGGDTPGPGSPGDGATAQEYHDFSKTEGLPSEHAFLQWELPEVGTLSLRVKLSGYVFIPSIALLFVGGCMVFAYKMRDAPHTGWVLFGTAMVSLTVLISASWFSHRLLRQHRPLPTPVKPVNLRRRVPHKTTDRALTKNKRKKQSGRNGKSGRRPRSR
jgi:hypothetical protein